MSRRIRIVDTTSCTGEPAPGLALPPGARAEIAEALERLGVDVVEAGFPARSPAELAGVRAVAAAVRTPVVSALAGPGLEEVDAALEALAGARCSRVNVVVTLGTEPRAAIERARRAVARARDRADEVELSCADAVSAGSASAARLFGAALAAGATVLGVCDSTGRALPHDYAALVAEVLRRRPELRDAAVGVRCRDDLGLAVAASLAAVRAGAGQVACAVNGAGVAALEEVVVALRVRSDHFGVETGVDAAGLAAVSRLVSGRTGLLVPPNKAVVGANAFAHEAGIHQDGMLKDERTYQIIDPREVGGRMTLPLGKHSGRHAFARALADRGLELAGEELNAAFRRFKALADGGRAVAPDELFEGMGVSA